MRKLGPWLAIISGLILTVAVTLSWLMLKDIMPKQSWLVNFSKDQLKGTASTSVVFGILIALGISQFLLGFFAFKDGRGLAAKILFLLIVVSMVFSIIGGEKSGFAISAIIMLSIQGIAVLGMIAGFARGV